MKNRRTVKKNNEVVKGFKEVSMQHSQFNTEYIESIKPIFKKFNSEHFIIKGNDFSDKIAKDLEFDNEESNSGEICIKIEFENEKEANSNIENPVNNVIFKFTKNFDIKDKFVLRSKDVISFQFVLNIENSKSKDNLLLCTIYFNKNNISTSEYYSEFMNIIYDILTDKSLEKIFPEIPNEDVELSNKELNFKTVEYVSSILLKFLGSYDNPQQCKSKWGEKYIFPDSTNEDVKTWQEFVKKYYDIWGRAYIHEIQNIETNYNTLAKIGDRKMYSLFSDFIIDEKGGVIDRSQHNDLENSILAKFIQSKIAHTCLNSDNILSKKVRDYVSIREDILEATFGAMYLSFISEFSLGEGYIKMYIFFKNLMYCASTIEEFKEKWDHPLINAKSDIDQISRSIGLLNKKIDDIQRNKDLPLPKIGDLIYKNLENNKFEIKMDDSNYPVLLSIITKFLSLSEKNIETFKYEQGVEFNLDISKPSYSLKISLTDTEDREIRNRKSKKMRLYEKLQSFFILFGLSREFSEDLQLQKDLSISGLTEEEIERIKKAQIELEIRFKLETEDVFMKNVRLSEKVFKIHMLISLKKKKSIGEFVPDSKYGISVSPSATQSYFVIFKKLLKDKNFGNQSQRKKIEKKE